MRVHISEQSPDIADGVHVDTGDFDDLVVQVPQVQIVEKTVEIQKITGESSTICGYAAG